MFGGLGKEEKKRRGAGAARKGKGKKDTHPYTLEACTRNIFKFLSPILTSKTWKQ